MLDNVDDVDVGDMSRATMAMKGFARVCRVAMLVVQREATRGRDGGFGSYAAATRKQCQSIRAASKLRVYRRQRVLSRPARSA
jgi:hypothetical protein